MSYFVDFMKILSINIRGVGVKGKTGWLKDLCSKERPCVLGIQETKCHLVNDFWIENVWGSRNFGFGQKEAEGSSGGIMIVWDSCIFSVTESVGGDGFIAVHGKWKNIAVDVVLVNVYGPQSDNKKVALWDRLIGLINGTSALWCVFRDFNATRKQDDRLNCNTYEKEMEDFNNFIDVANLMEVPLGGKRYTRFSDDETKFSKLDRFLVSEGFKNAWGNLCSVALDRFLSDHFPVVLKDKDVDFGPKPFRVFDFWLEENDIGNVVENAWNLKVRSKRPDCVFRDKLKNVKAALRVWSKERFGKLEDEICKFKSEATKWELEAERSTLSDDDLSRWLEARQRWISKENEKDRDCPAKSSNQVGF